MGVAALPIILAVAGAAAKGINTTRTAKKRDRATAEGIRRQGEEQRAANARINQTLNKFEKSESGDIRDQLSDRYRKSILLNQQKALAGLNPEGGSSAAFEARAGQRGGEVLSRADVFQDLFSRIDAPTDQRTLEGFERGDLSSDLSVFRRNSAAEDYLTRLRVGGIQRNPLLDILAAGLGGAASGVSARPSNSILPQNLTGATVANSGGQTPSYFLNPNNPRPPAYNPFVGSHVGNPQTGIFGNPPNFYRNRLP